MLLVVDAILFLNLALVLNTLSFHFRGKCEVSVMCILPSRIFYAPQSWANLKVPV